MRYRRADTAGGTHFYTVNLVERSSELLVRHVDYIHYNPVKRLGKPGRRLTAFEIA